MSWEMLAAMTPFTGIVGFAVWRFARVEAAVQHVETAVRHNSECQRTLAKMIGRLNHRVRHHRHDETGRMETIPDGE